MIKKTRLVMAVVLIGAAIAGLAAWGYARPAIASPERARSEGKFFGARNHAADELHRLKKEHGRSHSEGRDEESDDGESDDRESDDRDGVTTTLGGLTTATTAGATTGGVTTTTTGATTTTTGATTTTTGATTTTTQRATTTTTQAPTTTSTTAINAAPLFSSLCASCHGANGRQITSTQAGSILTEITTGSMSGYASSLNSAQKTALANYVAGGGR